MNFLTITLTVSAAVLIMFCVESDADKPRSGTGNYYTFVGKTLSCNGQKPGVADLVAGLGSKHFVSTNSPCGKNIKVTKGTQSITAKVVDNCKTCLSDNIRLSGAAFEALNGGDKSRLDIKVDWSFADSAASAPAAGAPAPAAETTTVASG